MCPAKETLALNRCNCTNLGQLEKIVALFHRSVDCAHATGYKTNITLKMGSRRRL
jgi:hypothetical protein